MQLRRIKWGDRKADIGSCSYLRKHFWDLKAAAEHENDSKDRMDEVIKLAHICCLLRVVIGHLPHKKDQQQMWNVLITFQIA